MQGVDGQWNGQLVANDYEIPLHPKSLTKLLVFNTIHQHLPSLQVGFKDDSAKAVAKMGLTDGAQIKLILGDGGSGQTKEMVFNMMGDLRMTGSTSADLIEFSAVLDHVQWLRQIVTGSIDGSSGDAIKRVAGLAGLTAQVHPTNDQMIWLPTNKPLASYARHVMEHGWASAESCMQLAVSDSGVLRYFDLDRIGASGGGLTFGLGGIPVLQYEVNGKADIYNNIAGYGSTSTNFSPEGVFKELNKVDVRLLSGSLAASARNIAAIGSLGGRVEPRALDTGNTHKMWNEAQHQNRRIRAIYAHDVNVLVDRVSNAELLDLANLQLVQHNGGDPLVQQTGAYIVSAYTRTLAGNRYLEKVTLTAQSTS